MNGQPPHTCCPPHPSSLRPEPSPLTPPPLHLPSSSPGTMAWNQGSVLKRHRFVSSRGTLKERIIASWTSHLHVLTPLEAACLVDRDPSPPFPFLPPPPPPPSPSGSVLHPRGEIKRFVVLQRSHNVMLLIAVLLPEGQPVTRPLCRFLRLPTVPCFPPGCFRPAGQSLFLFRAVYSKVILDKETKTTNNLPNFFLKITNNE